MSRAKGQTKLTPDELSEKIDEFDEYCIEKEISYTMASLAKFCGVHEETLINYKSNPDFSSLIKKAMQNAKIALMDNGLRGVYNPTLTIFLLKTNHGMQDKQVIENHEYVVTFDESDDGKDTD